MKYLYPLKNARLSQRMALAFGLVLLLLVGLTLVALHRIETMGQALKAVSVDAVERSDLLRSLQQQATDHSNTLRMLAAAVSSANEASTNKLAATLKVSTETIAKARGLIHDPAGLALLADVEQRQQAVAGLLDAARKDAGDRGAPAVAFSVRLMYTQALDNWTPKIDAWQAGTDKLSAWDTEQGRQQAKASAALADSARALLIGGALVAVALAAAMGWWLTRNVIGGVALAVQHAQRMAGHDLSVPIVPRQTDELGQLLQALEVLRVRQAELAANVSDASHAVLTAAQQIRSGSTELSGRTEQAAGVLQSTVSAVDGLGQSLDQTHGAVRHADELAVTARQHATEGEHVVSGAVATMANVIQSSQRIADITSLIDGIAFQTNILALNAAVEAARAGEQGRGFAVVATEVRQLAGRSAQAAKEIKGLIQSSQAEVGKGSEQVSLAGGSTRQVAESVKRVTDLVSDISRGAEAQLANVNRTRGAVRELEDMAQRNAAMAEETSAAAESLTGQASRLTELVQRFKLPQPA